MTSVELPRYHGSPTRAYIDAMFSHVAVRACRIIEKQLQDSGELGDLDPYFIQERTPQLVSDEGEIASLYVPKFQTMNTDGQLLGPFTRQLRSSGADELPQSYLIAHGSMCTIGWRPRPPEHMDAVYYAASSKLVDAHRSIRKQLPPGILGIVALRDHVELGAPDPDEVLAMEIEDACRASLHHDLRLIKEIVAAEFEGTMVDNVNGRDRGNTEGANMPLHFWSLFMSKLGIETN